MTDVVIGSGVTIIGEESFQSCSWLTGVTIPGSVTSIGKKAFANTGRLKTIELPSSITSIPNMLFLGSLGITGMTISSAVTSIGNSAFTGCENMAELIIEGTTPPFVGANAFSGTTNLTTPDFPIYVPDAAVNTYKGASSWSGYASRVKGISQRP